MSDLDYIEREAAATTLSGVQMVKRYGPDTSRWPAGHWRNLLDRAATLSPPPPTGPTFTGGDFDHFVRSLQDKQTGYLGPDVVGTLTYALALDNSQVPAQGVTVTSADPTRPGTIGGRLDMRNGVNGWTWDNLRFKETTPYGTTGASHVIAAKVTISRCDITNGNTKIGVTWNAGSDGSVVKQTRFHHLGYIFPTEAAARATGATEVNPLIGGGWVGNHDQGTYTENPGEAVTFTDCAFQHCADRGVQFRGATHSMLLNSLVELCGEGIIFGDIGASNCQASRNIIRNNLVAGRFLVEQTGTASGNIVDDNYIYNDDGRPAYYLPELPGVSVTNVCTGTPAAGYGPRFPVGC